MTMTESEWEFAAEPHAMLEFLQSIGRPSERKLRLFAVACSRRMWDQIDGLGRHAVDVAEKFADGIAGAEELRAARLLCQGAGGQAAWYAAASNPAIAARNAARSAQAGAAQLGFEADELLAQAHLVGEIFGDPIRPVSFAPAWRTPGIIELAHRIYEDRSFDQMPDVANALHQGGCNNLAILSHCRQLTVHVRGCWVVDLLLDKL
jgi:hypothetical protein